MSLMRPFTSIREDMNRIFNELDQEFLSPWRVTRPALMERAGEMTPAVWAPAVDVIEEDKEVKVIAQIPGIKPEDLDIEVENTSLSLSGESMMKEEEEKGNVCRKEIAYGKFFRRIQLPAEVQADKAKADFQHGMLTITLPKSEETRRHKIKLR